MSQRNVSGPCASRTIRAAALRRRAGKHLRCLQGLSAEKDLDSRLVGSRDNLEV